MAKIHKIVMHGEEILYLTNKWRIERIQIETGKDGEVNSMFVSIKKEEDDGENRSAGSIDT